MDLNPKTFWSDKNKTKNKKRKFEKGFISRESSSLVYFIQNNNNKKKRQ